MTEYGTPFLDLKDSVWVDLTAGVAQEVAVPSSRAVLDNLSDKLVAWRADGGVASMAAGSYPLQPGETGYPIQVGEARKLSLVADAPARVVVRIVNPEASDLATCQQATVILSRKLLGA